MSYRVTIQTHKDTRFLILVVSVDFYVAAQKHNILLSLLLFVAQSVFNLYQSSSFLTLICSSVELHTVN